MRKLRLGYAGVALLLLLTEVAIALWVHDRFVRPYLGDVLVVILLHAAGRTLRPRGWRWLPLPVFLLAAAVETGQYFHLLTLLGLGDNRFARVLFGTSFSWGDLLCYAAGCLLCAGADAIVRRVLPAGRPADPPAG